MSIICPSCGSCLNQITNSHIKSKHPEFKSVTEFKEFFKLDSLWSSNLRDQFVNTVTGKSRGPYNLTGKFYEGVTRAKEKRTGKNHWNYGKHWSIDDKIKISNGVKSSRSFQEAMKKWEDESYRSWRMEIINSVVIPANLVTRAKNGLITPFDDKDAWDQYRSLVNRYTRKSLLDYKHLIDPENLLEKREYDLDHRFSKFEGFKRGISPEIIGSPVNLTPLNWIENRQKRINCSITEEDLVNNYLNFISDTKSSESFKSRKP